MKTASRPALRDGSVDYCPFDIESDPCVFNLETVAVQTHYGSVVARTSRERLSDTATVYIHGVGADWTTWAPMIHAENALGLGVHDQIFVDLPGFGDSENKLDTLNIVDVGATVLTMVTSLGYEKARIVGHSMGGFLTLDMASRHADRIESIYLIAGPYFSILSSIQHPLASLVHSPVTTAAFGTQYLVALAGKAGLAAVRVAYQAGISRCFLFPVASHPFLLKDSVVKALCYQQNARGVIQTAANGPGYNALEQWGKITCPIRATFGVKDQFVPLADMSRFLECQPAAVCKTISDSSHLMHIERPFEVLEALELW
jgi:pimeloyl-ACP methyl ester carboxylesterase